MKNTLTLIAVLFLSFSALNAQMVEKPLEDKTTSEFIPEAPSPNHVYVKGHYEYSSGKYYWVDGAYVPSAPNHTWVDGAWVKDENSNLYSYSPGFWKSNAEIIEFNGLAYISGGSNINTVQMTTEDSFTEAIAD